MKPYLLALDFDKTAADTTIKSARGLGMGDVYALAVADVLGTEGSRIYQAQGGLNNRAPSELVQQIFAAAADRSILFAQARSFWSAHADVLGSFVPEGKGASLVWSHGDNVAVVGEILVRQKLSYLAQEVGKVLPDGRVWPPPCRGFEEFWSVVADLKRNYDITTAIISSGHDSFIQQTFDAWHLARPDILVTEDDIRGLKFPQEMEKRVKPGQLPIALAYGMWLRDQKTAGVYDDNESFDARRERVMYFGDDIQKDGGMALTANVPFGWYRPDGGDDGKAFRGFSFNDWRQVGLHLVSQKEGFCPRHPFW